MTSNPQGLPNQKISSKQKDKKWQSDTIDYYIGRVGVGGGDSKHTKYERMDIAYGLYDSEFDKNDFKYVTDPFDVGDTFPANMQMYNRIRPKIDLLLGEESHRGSDEKVIQTNYNVVSKIQEEYKARLIEALNAEIKGEQYPATVNDVQKYMRYNYKTTAEEIAFNLLQYYKEKLNIPNEFLRGLFDLMAARMEIYYQGVINGKPVFERVDPRDCDFDIDGTTDFIDQKNWFRRSFYMSPYAIYDRLTDMLDEDDLDKMLSMINQSSIGTQTDTRQSGIRFDESLANRFLRGDNKESASDELYCQHVTWRSFTKLGFLSVPKEDGTMETVLVDESYEPMPEDKIEWQWINEIWEGYKIGNDIYVARPLPYQHQSIDTINDNRLPYTGVVYNSTNSYGKSIIELMKPLQYLYMVIFYRIELAIAKDKGSVLNMDITQIPKKYGIDVDKWLHYLNALGVNFINPYEEGWDIPGREGGKAAAYNAISAQDLSTIRTIDSYIQLLIKIEDMIGEIVGVSKQREGNIDRTELVGNVERSVQQTSYTTAPLFYLHNQCKRRCYNSLINIAQYCWSNTNDRAVQFVLSDGARKFLAIEDDFIFADLDIFVTDSTKDSQNIEALRTLLQPAMQNGATLLDAVEILTSNNLSNIKNKLSEIQERRDQQMQMQQQQENELAQQQVAAQQQANEDNYNLKMEDLRIQEEDSIRQAETNILIASMRDGGEQSGENTGDNGLERMKLELQKDKQRLDNIQNERNLKLAERAQQEVERKNKVAEKQKVQELAIRKKQASRKPSNSK